MLIPNVASLFVSFLLPLYATTSAAASQNALGLIEAQPDLTLITALIKRDPELVKLYSTVKNATIVAAIDSSFSSIDPNNILYSNRAALRAILQDIVIRGLYPTSRITKKPIYPSTELTDTRLVDTSRGRAVAKLVEIDGKKTVDVGAGSRANITQGVRCPHLSLYTTVPLNANALPEPPLHWGDPSQSQQWIGYAIKLLIDCCDTEHHLDQPASAKLRCCF